MDLNASLYYPQHRRLKHTACQQDMEMYEALVGRRANIAAQPTLAETAIPAGTTPTPIKAERWSPKMADLKGRLRSMCESGMGHAFSRIDQAAARLRAARQPVEEKSANRVILTIRPEDVVSETISETDQTYKHVA